MENLPQDIIFDVLSRIPVKSVGRFKCVCKSWRSLLSKPEFVKTHLNLAITEDVSVGCRRLLVPTYICKSRSISIESIDYEALQLLSNRRLKKARKKKGGTNACTVIMSSDVELVGYCHGMVGMKADDDKIVICNPCTREFRELPKPSSLTPHSSISGGLGYDSSVDDYKFVIAVHDDDSDRGIKAEIFSLRSNSWTMLHDVGPDIFGFGVCGSAVFLNGALHWIAYSPGTREVIITFDLASEKFQDLFLLPPDLIGCKDLECKGWNLIVLGGYLSVSCHFYIKTQVWVMKEYDVEASWTKLYALDIQFNKDPRFHYLWPLCFSKNGDLLVNVDQHLIIYNPKEQTYRKLYKYGWWSVDNLIVAYKESLVSPNGNVEYNEQNIKQQP